MYLDDMLVMAESKEKLDSHIAQITSLLELLGFVVNREKSQLVPAQENQFMVDSKGKIRLTEEKATQISTACRKAREGIHISERINQIDWQDNGNSSCNSPSPAVVQRASASKEQSIPEVSVL